MSLSEESIKKYIRKDKILEEANLLVAEDKVKLTLSKNFWKGELLIKGKVSDCGCNVALNGEELVSYSCQCGKHLIYKGFCEQRA